MDANRRAFLAGLAAGGIAAAVPALAANNRQRVAAGESPQYFYLTLPEAAFLTAFVDELIPADDYPSASEAGVIEFIDLQLATGYGAGERLYLDGPHETGTESQGYQLGLTPARLYREGIRGIDDSLDGASFATLSPPARQELIAALEAGERDAGEVPGKRFFTEVRQNTIEGYFADPVYTGNRDAVGWKMIGFPGAHAYYLTEVDRHNMAYERQPAGIAYRAGPGSPAPLSVLMARKRARED
ncbi:MAG: gluconate 2-dehydrogenase subunit 3 family protein [Burkholderiaceae bacterium]